MVYVMFLTLFSHLLVSQDLSSEIEKNVFYFTIEERNFKGPGADKLLEEFKQADFINIGELHNRKQIARFTDAILSTVNSFDFGVLSLEVGPISANKLDSLSAVPTKTHSNLKAFNKRYKQRSNRSVIPFFKSDSDADFLATASKSGYEFWGIDQEGYYADKMLIDELISLNQSKNTSQSMHVYKELEMIGTDKCKLANSSTLIDFFDTFGKDEQEAQAIIDALKTSWVIFCHYQKQEYDANNTKRIQYMRDNFLMNYNNYKERHGNYPKVISKMGNVHIAKEVSPLGYEDIGHLIEEVCTKNNLNSISLRMMNRYFKLGRVIRTDWGKPKDKDWYDLLKYGKADEWTMIDMRPIRKKIDDGVINVSKEQKYEITNYDLMIITPTDYMVR